MNVDKSECNLFLLGELEFDKRMIYVKKSTVLNEQNILFPNSVCWRGEMRWRWDEAKGPNF